MHEAGTAESPRTMEGVEQSETIRNTTRTLSGACAERSRSDEGLDVRCLSSRVARIVIPSSSSRSNERNEEDERNEGGRSRIFKDLTRVDHTHGFLERISGMVPKAFPANQASKDA